ncbi:MAG: type 1 glutamine amidotransferase domain-containing protein [Candidatus Cyclobacteriaceae bacterium M2_1C_046]
MKNILMILTSHKELQNSDSTTGVWLGEFTDPYYEFIDKGYTVTLASPKGGKPPVDPKSEITENITSSNRRFKDDQQAQEAFQNTKGISEVKAEDYDAVFYPGGHGPVWDLATDSQNANLVLDFYRNYKPIAAVCHGPAALLKAAEKIPEIVKDREITAYSNTEEKLSGMSSNIPYTLEDRLKELGGIYDSATVPFTSNVKVTDQVITGQNPASARKAAKELIDLLEK